jgi:hypothetical protein
MMKFVVFVAVAFGCVAPLAKLWQNGAFMSGTTQGLVYLILFEAVAVPLVWSMLSFTLIRRGSWRDLLIVALLLWSVCVALGIAISLFVAFLLVAWRSPKPSAALYPLMIHLVVVLALAASARILLVHVRRKRKRKVAQ